MANAWYYSVAGKQVGPVSGDVLKQMAGAGALGREDLVRADDMQQWVLARTVDGLFPQQPQVPPPPAPNLTQVVGVSQSIAGKKSYKLPVIVGSAALLVVVGVVVGVLLTRSGGAGNGSGRVADPANSSGNTKVEDPDAVLAKSLVGSFTAVSLDGKRTYRVTHTLYPDGNYAYKGDADSHDGSALSLVVKGNWRIANGFLITTWDLSTYMCVVGSETAPLPPGREPKELPKPQRVVSCDKAVLVLEGDGGGRTTYTRNL